MAQILFNCDWFQWFARDVLGSEGHDIEITNKRGTICFTCEVAREFTNRTPFYKKPINNTWTNQKFLSGLQDDQILGTFGDTHLLTEKLLIALIEDTEKYHRNLSPKLNVVLKSTISRTAQIMVPGPRNNGKPLGKRVNEYFKEVGGIPKMFLVTFPYVIPPPEEQEVENPFIQDVSATRRPQRIKYQNQFFDLKSMGMYCNKSHWKSILLKNNSFWVVDCNPPNISLENGNLVPTCEYQLTIALYDLPH